MKRLFGIFVFAALLLGLGLAGCTEEKTKIRVATDPTWPPFENFNEATQKIEGFDIDLMEAIAAKANLEVEFVGVAWDPLLDGMAQCKYDAAISTMTITDERKEKMLFSDSYFNARQVIVVQAANTAITGRETLAGKRLGAQFETTGAAEAYKVENATVKIYDDIFLALQDLLNGQLDAVIADNPLVTQYMRSSPGKVKTAGDPLTDELYGIAVCNKDTNLRDQINKGLAAVKADGTYETLLKKWGLSGEK